MGPHLIPSLSGPMSIYGSHGYLPTLGASASLLWGLPQTASSIYDGPSAIVQSKRRMWSQLVKLILKKKKKKVSEETNKCYMQFWGVLESNAITSFSVWIVVQGVFTKRLQNNATTGINRYDFSTNNSDATVCKPEPVQWQMVVKSLSKKDFTAQLLLYCKGQTEIFKYSTTILLFL